MWRRFSVLYNNVKWLIINIVSGRFCMINWTMNEVIIWLLLLMNLSDKNRRSKLSVRLSAVRQSDRQTETASCCADSGSPLRFLLIFLPLTQTTCCHILTFLFFITTHGTCHMSSITCPANEDVNLRHVHVHKETRYLETPADGPLDEGELLQLLQRSVQQAALVPSHPGAGEHLSLEGSQCHTGGEWESRTHDDDRRRERRGAALPPTVSEEIPHSPDSVQNSNNIINLRSSDDVAMCQRFKVNR